MKMRSIRRSGPSWGPIHAGSWKVVQNGTCSTGKLLRKIFVEIMKRLSMTGAILLIVGLVACSKEKPKPLVPLPLDPGSKPQAIALTEQGTRAFQTRQFEDAKTLFSQAVSLAPESGQAHYNYALALNAL